MTLQFQAELAGRTDARELEGKVAAVTGAPAASAARSPKRLPPKGRQVVVSDVTQDAASATAAQIDGADAVACDVSDEGQVAELFAGVFARHGRVDIAVANAGISGLGPIVELSFADWRKMMAVNLDGVFLTVKSMRRAR